MSGFAGDPVTSMTVTCVRIKGLADGIEGDCASRNDGNNSSVRSRLFTIPPQLHANSTIPNCAVYGLVPVRVRFCLDTAISTGLAALACAAGTCRWAIGR